MNGGERLSPPLVKLFANGMSKWTGAIFGILDVLLSMPKNSHTGQHKCQKQESLSWSRRQRGVTNHPQTRKQTGYDGSLNLLTFNLQMSTLWIIMLGCWTTNKKYLTVRACVYWSNSVVCAIRILKKTDVQGSDLRLSRDPYITFYCINFLSNVTKYQMHYFFHTGCCTQS